MFQKKWIKDYFTFTRKDRIGAFVFIAAVGASVFAPKLFSNPAKPLALKEDTVLLLAVDTLQKRQTVRKDFAKSETDDYASYRYERSETKSFTAGALFDFDPNTASVADWQRLGLNERTSKTILKYLSKGGRFLQNPKTCRKYGACPKAFTNG